MTADEKRDRSRYRLNEKLLLLVLLCSTLLSACSVSTLVIFTNATPQTVTISYKTEGRHVVSVVVGPNAKAEIKALLTWHFSIRRQDLNFDYDAAIVPEAFIEDVGFELFFKRVAKAQLETDGCIYLLAIKDDRSGLAHAAQPEGFPLCPNKR